MRKVYVVSIPWDSSRVDGTFVFANKKRAEAFCEAQNLEGYNGYCGGLFVEDCVIDMRKGV